MPILEDIMDHQVIGPAIRKGMAAGRIEGALETAHHMLRRLLSKRFGPLPAWAETKLATMSTSELEEAGLRIFDVQTLEEVLS